VLQNTGDYYQVHFPNPGENSPDFILRKNVEYFIDGTAPFTHNNCFIDETLNTDAGFNVSTSVSFDVEYYLDGVLWDTEENITAFGFTNIVPDHNFSFIITDMSDDYARPVIALKKDNNTWDFFSGRLF
jgi:hypothetical protein